MDAKKGAMVTYSTPFYMLSVQTLQNTTPMERHGGMATMASRELLENLAGNMDGYNHRWMMVV